MSRFLTSALACVSATTAVYSQDGSYRWGSGFAMGTVENIVNNGDGASFNIYCPSGQIDTTPGIFFRSKRYNPDAGEQQQMQVVADGKAVIVTIEEGHFEARGRIAAQSMWEIVDLLAHSNANSFTVEVPRYQVAEEFSLVGAADELMIDGKLAIESCLP